MKKGKIKNKFFSTNREYFNFINRDDVSIINVTYTHNFKIKVTYVIINVERKC